MNDGFLRLFPDALIVFGLLGVLVFTAIIPVTPSSGMGEVSEISSPVEAEFRAMGAAMDDAALAAGNAGKSIRSARATLDAVAASEESMKKTLDNTGKTLELGAKVSLDVAGAFTSVHKSISLIGISQFGHVSEKFTVLSESLEEASGNINDVSGQVSETSRHLRETSQHLEENAKDMDKLSEDFEVVGGLLEEVSDKFTTNIEGFYDFRKIISLGLVYLAGLHAVLAGIGYYMKKEK